MSIRKLIKLNQEIEQYTRTMDLLELKILGIKTTDKKNLVNEYNEMVDVVRQYQAEVNTIINSFNIKFKDV